MTFAIEPAEPVTVEVALGCGTSRTVTVHWEGDIVRAQRLRASTRVSTIP